MENEAYDELPEPIYTRGYLRNYARLLQLDAEPLLKIYDASVGVPPSAPKVDYQVAVRKTVGESVISKQHVIAALIAGVFMAAVWFWFSSEPAVDTQSASQEAAPTASTDTPPAQERAPAEALPAEVIPEAQTPIEAGNVQKLELPLPEVASAPQPVVAATEESAPVVAEVPAVYSEVTVRGLGDSWVEVTDANKTQLIFQLIRHGQVKKVKGVAPFKVMLGYAPGVEILVDGNLYDHKPFIRKDIARFTIE